MHLKHKFATPFGQFEVEYEGSIKDIHQQIYYVSEALGHHKCGSCGSENIQPAWRNVEGNNYYSILCTDCNHSLQLGQYKKGDGLFAKRGEGWKKYVKPDGDEDEAAEDSPKPKRQFGKK